MNNNDSYAAWLEKRRTVEPSSDFNKNVLTQISLVAQMKSEAKPGWELARWLEWISLRPLIQAALVIVGFVAGMARLVAIFQIILSPLVVK